MFPVLVHGVGRVVWSDLYKYFLFYQNANGLESCILEKGRALALSAGRLGADRPAAARWKSSFETKIIFLTIFYTSLPRLLYNCVFQFSVFLTKELAFVIRRCIIFSQHIPYEVQLLPPQKIVKIITLPLLRS